MRDQVSIRREQIGPRVELDRQQITFGEFLSGIEEFRDAMRRVALLGLELENLVGVVSLGLVPLGLRHVGEQCAQADHRRVDRDQTSGD